MKQVLVVIAILAAPAAADVAPPPDTIVAEAALGPAATVKDLCAECTVAKAPKVKLKKPYQKVGLATEENDDAGTAYLSVKLNDQLYLAPLATYNMDGANFGDVSVSSIQVKDVIPGGAPELLVRGGRSDMYSHHGPGVSGEDYDVLWVCAVGATGAPSCAEVLLGVSVTVHEYGEGKPYKIRVRHRFEKDGRITRKLRGKWPSRKVQGDKTQEKSDWVNTRTLLFP